MKKLDWRTLDWRTMGLTVMWCTVIGATVCALIFLRIRLYMAPLLGYRTALLPAIACCFCLLLFVALSVPMSRTDEQCPQIGGVR